MAQPPPQGGPVPPMQMQPGQQPSAEQIRQMQAQLAAEAQKAGMTVPQYVEKLKAQAMQQHQIRQQQAQQQQAQGGQPQHQHQHQQGAQPGQQVPIQPGPPKPEALAVAKFLQSQNLKQRTCIFQEKRKDMFKVKRALRALHSDAYKKARSKNPLLPEVKDRVTAENAFKLLPLSLLALRVSKVDPHEGHNHGKGKKRVKGLWTVKIEQQQEARDEYHYVWLYEGAQWKNKLYAAGALFLILAVVFFPVWPYHLRLGVWYLSLLGLFFAMAIFRLILFLITMFTTPPGLWLYPNLFEDVGFFDSFRPVWSWHEDEKAMKKRKKEERVKKRAKKEGKKDEGGEPNISEPVTASATGTESVPADGKVGVQQRNLSARVEEVEDE
ncbi:Translocation protein S62 [Vermiconidia calcicola]|uniref:Translocation protein S62 n=1 Tax=Vermiconidia calcicola TaxID=1690605 RepID=A0ACC3MDS2_9PEZI|nr:Translocation protein S62 [Vermiconidia calcicola]